MDFFKLMLKVKINKHDGIVTLIEVLYLLLYVFLWRKNSWGHINKKVIFNINNLDIDYLMIIPKLCSKIWDDSMLLNSKCTFSQIFFKDDVIQTVHVISDVT